jgi:hypothetical protein
LFVFLLFNSLFSDRISALASVQQQQGTSVNPLLRDSRRARSDFGSRLAGNARDRSASAPATELPPTTLNESLLANEAPSSQPTESGPAARRGTMDFI